MPYPSPWTIPSARLAPDPARLTTPTGLTATATFDRVTVTWQASPDAAVVGYQLFRDGVRITTIPTTSQIDASVTSGVRYAYTVAATDTGGNLSPQSAAVSVLVPYPPPSWVMRPQIPGLNSTHRWLPVFGASFPINQPGGFPRVRLTGEIAGWGMFPDGPDNRTSPVGRALADRVRASQIRGSKRLTYQGVIEASTEADLRGTIGALQAALGDPVMAEGVMRVEPWAGGTPVEYQARVVGLDVVEATRPGSLGRATRGFERTFTLQVEMSRGRMFSTSQSRADAASGQTDLTVTVGGTAPTEPIITLLASAAATDAVSHLTLAQSLGFLTLPDNSGLQIDFAARTIRNGSGIGERRGYRDPANASWWTGGHVGLVVGAQTVRRVPGRAGWTIQWRDAWW